MGLKARKIKTMIEEYYDQCVSNLNSKLGTSFSFEVDWSAIPENLDGWNFEDDVYKQCFFNSYFHPLEETFSELFKDDMYKEEICKQIKTISIEPGREMIADYDFQDGTFKILHTMCANQKKLSKMFMDAVTHNIQQTIDDKLS